MKVLAALALTGLALAQDDATDTATTSSRPGLCKGKGDSDCAKYPGYTCVSVESGIPSIGMLSQCVKSTNPCGGGVAGPCPSFSSWPKTYRRVQPVCAFQEVANCVNAVDANGKPLKPSKNSEAMTVDCYQTTFNNNTVLGIYKCVDRKIFEETNMGGLAAKQIKACDGNRTTPQGDLGLCNSHGTCAPTNAFSPEYKCICNAGYSINDKCLLAVDNVCDAFGQCGDKGSCDPKTGQCVCKKGAAGDQCSKCDPAASPEDVCNGPTQGSCGIDGTCQCKEGYEGIMCEKSVSTDVDSEPAASSASLSSVSTIVLGVFFLYWM
jgi:hypothetical protein